MIGRIIGLRFVLFQIKSVSVSLILLFNFPQSEIFLSRHRSTVDCTTALASSISSSASRT